MNSQPQGESFRADAKFQGNISSEVTKALEEAQAQCVCRHPMGQMKEAVCWGDPSPDGACR